MIRTHPWWDTCDRVVYELISPLNEKFPELLERVDGWIADENMWARRVAVLSQVTAKGKTDQERLRRYCEATIGERDPFIQKAIGMALRDYSRTNKEFVSEFLEKHEGRLIAAAKKEARKFL
jgi:3-methyladenine DNA glycosylase AlkD